MDKRKRNRFVMRFFGKCRRKLGLTEIDPNILTAWSKFRRYMHINISKKKL